MPDVFYRVFIFSYKDAVFTYTYLTWISVTPNIYLPIAELSRTQSKD